MSATILMHPKKRKARDPNQLATSIVKTATTEQIPEPTQDEARSAAARILGRLGGLKGGRARAEKLSPKRRREIAKKAIAARWAKSRKS